MQKKKVEFFLLRMVASFRSFRTIMEMAKIALQPKLANRYIDDVITALDASI
ncbi:MAG: hypothetical protein HXS52_11830 [Theionarchaea archaeon]|nr:hypothetical protein [Theionarchaea archaeon]